MRCLITLAGYHEVVIGKGASPLFTTLSFVLSLFAAFAAPPTYSVTTTFVIS